MASTPSLADLVAIERTGPNDFVSKSLPIRMGNAAPIAYGGCAIGIAVRCAFETVPAGFTPYSILGHFLGPAATDQKLYGTVEEVRSTRTFATRRVKVRQRQKDGSMRSCLEATVDFQVLEESAMDYNPDTLTAWPAVDYSATATEQADAMRRRGVLSEAAYKAFSASVGISNTLYDTRVCVNGVGSQNLSGSAKEIATSQDALHITRKSSAEWYRSLSTISGAAANFAAMSFLMDSGLSFAPLTHDHKWFDDVGACSTLDFALRVFVPAIDMNSWMLKERATIRGGFGRTYSEGRLWDDKGQLLVSMTQQSIMRPKKVRPKM